MKWARAVEALTSRTLLSARAPGRWGYREDELLAEGFSVGAASPQGGAQYGRLVAAGEDLSGGRLLDVPPLRPAASPPPPSELPAAFANVDRSSPDAVAAAVLELWYGWDATKDSGPYDAKLRALPLLDPATVSDLVAHPPVSGPGAEWLALVDAGAIAAVSTAPGVESGAPADTDIRAYRQVEVTQTFTGNPTPPPAGRIVSVVVKRGFDGWRVLSVMAK